MFLLQQPEDSTSLRKLIKFLKMDLSRLEVIVYGRNSELPAFTLSRAFSTLRNKIIMITNIYDFLFLQNPYVEISKVIAFTEDENELRELIDNLGNLGVDGDIYYCGSTNIKPRYNYISLFSLDKIFCEINLSLSILKSLTGGNTERERRIKDQLSDLTDLDNYIRDKAKAFNLDLPMLLSPIMTPTKSFLEKLGLSVSTYFDIKILDGVQVVYSGVDMHIMRRIIFSLRSEGKKVNEILLDVDPLLAPIYLSMIMFYLKKR
ncbi:hypothetical protein V6M85_04795 [Sulfolobus tengchongensis]|uniref:Uncharacterized protein n=1 Tax=Sulfolobus tengchongensis TaxID=207809 RepID=A0AAX4L2P9_9CREN